jgi:hypothetical protein
VERKKSGKSFKSQIWPDVVDRRIRFIRDERRIANIFIPSDLTLWDQKRNWGWWPVNGDGLRSSNISACLTNYYYYYYYYYYFLTCPHKRGCENSN